ncbi:MAG: tyrosine-type recombinase/integrase [Armatimonadetes bacterium]|nr:tyrosine-type recombinase/integrase [Armatimonadota bacterium]
MSSKAARIRRPKSEGLTARGEILYIRPHAEAWPQATERSTRPGTFEAKGIGPDGKRKSFYGRTAYEASYKAAESLGLHEDLDDLSLHTFYCSSYWPSMKARSYNWREQIRWAYDNYIGPKWGGVDLPAIRKKDVQAWFNLLLGTMANSSLHKVKIVFSGIMNAAIDEFDDRDDGRELKNPVARVKLPAKEDPQKTVLTPYEVRRLIESSQGREVPAVLLCAIGLRKSEACGVQRNTIAGGVEVLQQIAYEKGKGFYPTPTLKTRQSLRTVPLPKDLEERLLNAGQVSDIFICSDSLGGFLTPKNLDRELAAAVKRAGIRKVTPHELRHTFISLLENELEVPDSVVAALAGRAKRGRNSEYSKSFRSQMERAMDRYWKLVMTAEADGPLQVCTTAVVVH